MIGNGEKLTPALRTVGGKSTRSYVIDTQLLEDQLGVPTDTWKNRCCF